MSTDVLDCNDAMDMGFAAHVLRPATHIYSCPLMWYAALACHVTALQQHGGPNLHPINQSAVSVSLMHDTSH